MASPDDSHRKPGPPGAVPVAPGDTKEDATTFAVLPQFDGPALMPQTPGKLLTALKSQISQLKIEVAGSGIRHEKKRYAVLPKTLRSAWMARINHPSLGEIRFLIGQTRSTWVVVCDTPHEKLYEDPRLMGVELKRRDVARTAKGKRMYVTLVEKSDLDTINAIAAKDASERGQPDSLAPTVGAFDMEQVLARLRQCELLGCTFDDFDLSPFLAGIHFMTPTQASASNYYYLEAGDPEDPRACELHVGHDPGLPAATWGHKATLRYKAERAYLYLDIRY